MLVVPAGHAHGRESAVQEKSSIRLQIRMVRTRLRKHRLHRQDAPTELGRPDLLALVREQSKLPQFVLEAQAANAGFKAKDRRGQWTRFDERLFLFSEQVRRQVDGCFRAI